MKAGKLLMKKYNLYWTPCAAHCIDLMFEDIDKIATVSKLITNARKITNFIYKTPKNLKFSKSIKKLNNKLLKWLREA